MAWATMRRTWRTTSRRANSSGCFSALAKRVLARLIPRAELVIVRGGGHLFLIDQAEESAALIRDFLA